MREARQNALSRLPSTEGSRMRKRQSIAVGLLLLVASTQAGCSASSAPAAERATFTTTAPEPEIPEHVVKCNPNDPANRRPLPSRANVTRVKDTRKGGIYACNYLIDEGLPVNRRLTLNRVSKESVPVSNFVASGSLGGFAIFGTGVVSGDVRAEGESSAREFTVVNVADIDGRQRTVALDRERVAIKVCDDPCKPSLYLGVDPVRLFDKVDSRSIWIGGNDRGATVKSVSISLPDDARDGAGGPRPLSQVIASLVPPGNVILTVPESMQVALSGS